MHAAMRKKNARTAHHLRFTLAALDADDVRGGHDGAVDGDHLDFLRRPIRISVPTDAPLFDLHLWRIALWRTASLLLLRQRGSMQILHRRAGTRHAARRGSRKRVPRWRPWLLRAAGAAGARQPARRRLELRLIAWVARRRALHAHASVRALEARARPETSRTGHVHLAVIARGGRPVWRRRASRAGRSTACARSACTGVRRRGAIRSRIRRRWHPSRHSVARNHGVSGRWPEGGRRLHGVRWQLTRRWWQGSGPCAGPGQGGHQHAYRAHGPTLRARAAARQARAGPQCPYLRSARPPEAALAVRCPLAGGVGHVPSGLPAPSPFIALLQCRGVPWCRGFVGRKKRCTVRW